MWLVTVIAGFIFFTDTHVRSWRVLGGALPCAAASRGGLSRRMAGAAAHGRTASISSYGSILQLLVSGLITFVLGGLVGAFILGVYLFVSIRIFGRHSNEAFSSLRIQDFKQWLRLRIDASGSAHDLCHCDRPGAAALARGAAQWRGDVRGGRRARHTRRGSSTGLKCAPDGRGGDAVL